MQYTGRMKTSTIPPIRVEPAFRQQVEQVLAHGETLSEFVENAIRDTVSKRQFQSDFVQRGLAAIDEVKRQGGGIPAEVVLANLQAKLVAAKRAKTKNA
jgi:predicted transcriptional regulator